MNMLTRFAVIPKCIINSIITETFKANKIFAFTSAVTRCCSFPIYGLNAKQVLWNVIAVVILAPNWIALKMTDNFCFCKCWDSVKIVVQVAPTSNLHISSCELIRNILWESSWKNFGSNWSIFWQSQDGNIIWICRLRK